MPGLYLCVDCGGSKTSCVISSPDGKIVGRALAGPSNFSYLGTELFISAVATAVSSALQTCVDPPSTTPVPLPPPRGTFAAAWFGVSGVDSPATIASLTPLVATLLAMDSGPHLIIANDTALLAAPVRLHPDVTTAVAVIGGTGSCVVAMREREGAGAGQGGGELEELGRTGGWGWILGDEGGGFHVGREAVRAIVLEADRASLGGAQPLPLANGQKSLRERILERFNAQHPLELLAAVHLPDPVPSSASAGRVDPHLTLVREKRLSSLAPLVFAAAFEAEDPLALRVLRFTAGCLADQVALVCDHKSGPRAVDASESVLCLGGSLVGVQAYRDILLDELRQRGHIFKYVNFVDDAAAVGAIGLAKVHGGADVNAATALGGAGLGNAGGKGAQDGIHSKEL